MSGIISPEKSGGLFSYTQKAYWGGPWYKYWTLIVITILGGFFGLDHLYLRSPLTAMAKFFFNVFSLGLWYVYDVCQILGEPDSVKTNGLSIPIFGAAGIGSGMFVDNQPNVAPSRSPLRWLAYMGLVFLPFGFDLLVAGDTNGALAKFLATMSIFLLPISLIWSAYSIGSAWLTPKAIWEQGTPRLFPFTFFMNSKGRSILGPVDVPQSKDSCDPGGVSGIINGFISSTVSPIVQAGLTATFPAVIPATTAAASAVSAGATAAKVGFDTATEVLDKTGNLAEAILNAAKNPAVQMTAVASDLAQKGPMAAAAIPGLTGAVGNQLESLTNPAMLRKAAGLQTGGGQGSSDEMGHLALLTFFLAVLGSGSYFAAKRLNIQIPFFSRLESNGLQRNDTPPKP